MIFYDTETCGFHGPIVLLQYALDDGPIKLYCPWKESIAETITLFDWMMSHRGGVCGFNLAFDHFHLCQMYTVLLLMDDPDAILEDCIEEYAVKEALGRDGPCLKPVSALDLMLHARKGPYQSTMDRSDIRIKKVPRVLAEPLAEELEKAVPLPDILFAKQQDIQHRWSIMDLHDEMGNLTDFRDIVLKFKPSSALKALANDALGIDNPLLMRDIGVPLRATPVAKRKEEFGYAPFCTAVGSPSDWKGAWPDYGRIRYHIEHWTSSPDARQYATDDVDYTRRLYCYFSSMASGRYAKDARRFQNLAHCDFSVFQREAIKPLPSGDDDSELACMVGAVRWKGFSINSEGLKDLKSTAQAVIDKQPSNFQSPVVCQKYLEEVLDETEKTVIRIDDKITTKGLILEEISTWMVDTVCELCSGQGCTHCDGGLVHSDKPHPAALRAKAILATRRAKKEIELYDKLLRAGRFHASFHVIGTLSSRMSGTDGLNPQGIKRDKTVRNCFSFVDDNLMLCGGDFDGFEISLMDAAYGDPVLHAELESGKKIHALAGVFFFDMTYEEILATRGLPDPEDKYDRSKKGVFALFYGGEAYTLKNRVGIPESKGDEAYRNWCRKYTVWGEARRAIFDQFCSMRQPNGIGTRVEWHEPSDYIESLFGFRRYFTLENKLCRALFNLGENPPEEWKDLRIKVVRRDREQTGVGAVRSACFAAAFQIQAANMRAAANHVIQSSGGTITKGLQRRLWDLQPTGVNGWKIQPFNVHDEIQAPMIKELIPESKKVINDYLAEIRETVPLVALDWKEGMKTWADK